MEKNLWLNLSSKDLKRAREFYSRLGFVINDQHPNPEMLSLFVGANKVVVNFFSERLFQNFIGGQSITDVQNSNEVLFSIGAASASEVDEMAKRAKEAGGRVYGGPAERDGWMYGCGIVDPDGHRWNFLYMDMSKLPR